MTQKAKTSKSQACCSYFSPLLSKPTGCGREICPKMWPTLWWLWEGEVPQNAPESTNDIFDAEEVFN